MNRIITRAAALIAAAAISVCAVSCGSKEEKKEKDDHNMVAVNVDGDVSLDELGYGATQHDDTPETSDVPIGVSYDPRYVTAEEAAKVVDYFYSLSTKDAAMHENAVYPAVLKYRLESLEQASTQDLLNNLYDIYKGYTEKDFEFTYVLIEDIVEEKNDKSAYEEYDYVLSQVAPDAKVTDKKLLKVNCTYTEPGGHGSYSLMLHRGNKYVDVAVYTIDGEPYVIS